MFWRVARRDQRQRRRKQRQKEWFHSVEYLFVLGGDEPFRNLVRPDEGRGPFLPTRSDTDSNPMTPIFRPGSCGGPITTASVEQTVNEYLALASPTLGSLHDIRVTHSTTSDSSSDDVEITIDAYSGELSSSDDQREIVHF